MRSLPRDTPPVAAANRKNTIRKYGDFAMKEIYTPETKAAIDRVITVFQDYIKTCPYFEVLWSDKVGYIYLNIDTASGRVGDIEVVLIESAEELLDHVLYEFAVDMMEEGGHTVDPTEASKIERAEIERRLAPYMEQLPMYGDRVERVFAQDR